MTEEKKLTVSEMLRMTGQNTDNFMKQVAEHIDRLEEQVRTLANRVIELEKSQNDAN